MMKNFLLISVILSPAFSFATQLVSFSAYPDRIQAGDTAFLNWIATSAVACQVDSAEGSIKTELLPPSGQLLIKPIANISFVLTCQDGNGDLFRLKTEIEVTQASAMNALFWETFDLGHFLNHAIYDWAFKPMVAKTLKLAAAGLPLWLVGYIQKMNQVNVPKQKIQ